MNKKDDVSIGRIAAYVGAAIIASSALWAGFFYFQNKYENEIRNKPKVVACSAEKGYMKPLKDLEWRAKYADNKQ